MAPHLDQRVRELIISWRYNDNLSVPEIAHLARCSTMSVYNVLGRFQDCGEVNSRTSSGRPRALTMEDVDFISSLIEENPVIYLDEIQLQLEELRGVHVSLATVSRTLHNLSLSHKKISKAALERNELLRATWLAEWGDLPAEYLVWIDESSVDNLTNQRRQGWAEVGRACVRRDTFLRGQRYSILPALTVEGIITLEIFEGSVNKEKFMQFLRENLVYRI